MEKIKVKQMKIADYQIGETVGTGIHIFSLPTVLNEYRFIWES